VLVTGVSTNVCVESTIRDACMRDYHAVLVEDCCAAGCNRCRVGSPRKHPWHRGALRE
jgi:nicotinamidase-related amidase